MTGIEYLLDQVMRAERLTKHALDILTVNQPLGIEQRGIGSIS